MYQIAVASKFENSLRRGSRCGREGTVRRNSAPYNGNEKVVKMLLGVGSEALSVHADGNTSLHIAAHEERIL